MNILAFFAHPDDETMLAGGTLSLLARSGAKVHYLCATRGEGGEVGEPPLCTREELGNVREQELVCAVNKLGGSSLTFLGYNDPTVGPEDELYAYSDDLTFLAGQVATTLRQFQAEFLITHGSNGEYGHPAHLLTHRAARLAVESLNRDPSTATRLLYTVSANFTGHPRPRIANKDDPASLVIDIATSLESKIQAALCHRTQHALFVRRTSQEAGRQLSVPEAIVPVESLYRAFPQQDGEVDDELGELLRPWRHTA